MSISPSGTLERVASLPVNSVKRQKRATALTLTLMAAAPVVLLIWDPLYREMRIFDTTHGCGSALSEAQCQVVLAEVQRRNDRMAPTYDELEDCEKDFARLIRQCKTGEWCEPEAVSTCTVNDQGEIHAPAAGFMISEGLYQRLIQSEMIDWATVADNELQPIYTLGTEMASRQDFELFTYGSSSSGSHYGSAIHGGFYNSRGMYLTDRNTTVNLNRKFLSDSQRLHQSNFELLKGRGMPSRFYKAGTASRGGFGSTARSGFSSGIS